VVRVPAEQTLAAYLTSGWIEGIEQSTLEDISVNGFAAATAAAKGDQWDFRLYAIRFGSDVYRFIFATKHSSPESDRIFRESVGTFRRMSLAEIESAKPLRLQVVTVGPSDTVEKLAMRMAVTDRIARTLPRAQRPGAGRAAQIRQRSEDRGRVAGRGARLSGWCSDCLEHSNLSVRNLVDSKKIDEIRWTKLNAPTH